MKVSFRRLGAAVAALAVGCAGAVAAVAPANAATTETGEGINPNMRGSITVQVYEAPDTPGEPGNGLQLDPSVAGDLTKYALKYTPWKIKNIDLTKAEDWQTLEANWDNPQWAIDNAESSSSAFSRDAEGKMTMTSATVGAYLLRPDTNSFYGEPFMVTVPFRDPVTNEWNYNVFAHPKVNIEDSWPSKHVSEPGDADNLTGKAEFVVKAPIDRWYTFNGPNVPQFNAKVGAACQNDAFNAPGTVRIVGNGVDQDVTSYFTAYKFGKETAQFYVKREVLSDFNAELKAAIAIDPAVELVYNRVILPTDACAASYPDGIVAGQTGYGTMGANVNPYLTATYKFGHAQVLKHEDGSEATTLAGADFALFADKAAADAAAAAVVAGTAPDLSGAISTGTTGTDGLFTVGNLGLSNWVNGAEVADEADYRSYWLVETKAPDTYKLLDAAQKVTLTTAGATEVVKVANAKDVVPAPAFPLPLTGGAGTGVFALAGLSILGIALAVRRRTVRTERA